ncbi:MAG: hypothetical protein MJZ26_13895 [Fibrobacter sp.]|nr:hypothetical protein [Fibrobacter sp.]
MIILSVLCVLALVVLFFPFIFKVEFEVSMAGAVARLYLFKKLLKKFEKSFGKKDGSEADELDDYKDDEPDVVPAYVPAKKSTPPEPPKETLKAPEPPKETVAENSEKKEQESSTNECLPEPAKYSSEKISENTSPESKPAEKNTEQPVEKSSENTALESKPVTEGAVTSVTSDDKPQDEDDEEPKKKEKRSLTDREFWSIILTPELDNTAFWAVKKLLACLLKLFRIKFRDCFVEGIRSDYVTMGYGAALNGIIKSFPFLENWDLRMDWTHDHEMKAEGRIFISVNLVRILGLLIAILFYGGIVAFKFWRRRAHVLKTNELPELDWVRKKIVKFMAED